MAFKGLKVMQAEVVANCKDKGWYDEPITFGECMALLHSEVSEALEAWRSWKAEDATAFSPMVFGQRLPKPEGIGSEFADVLIRLLDDCDRWGVDLEAEFERKMAYNRTRPYQHGGRTL